jgi:arylsulfatase A-like enzyme
MSPILVTLLLACSGDDPAGTEPSPTPAPTTPAPTGPTGTDTSVVGTDTATAPTADTATTVASPLAFDGDRPQHLLMISIDTLRRDALAHYGGDGAMPWLDGLLAESVHLDDHLSCSNWTMHATSCAMTGQHPMSFGFLPSLLQSPPPPVPAGTPMLADWLGDAGFVSALVTTNAIFSSNYNNAAGFDEEILSPNTRNTPAAGAAAELSTLMADMPPGSRRYAHLHLMEPHQPYDPPVDYLADLEPLGPIPYDLTTTDGHNAAVYDLIHGALEPDEAAVVEQHMLIRYRGEVAWLDDQLSAWWAELDAGGWLDDTLVVVWTDHGEQFFEHGYQTHAWTLHREENDALLFFWAKNLPAMAHGGPTSGIDMVPTVLGALGVPTPSTVEGLPLGSIPDDRPRFATAAGKGGIFQAVVHQGHKLHYSWTDPADPPPYALVGHGAYVFDRADLAEQVDLFDPSDPLSQSLWTELVPHIEAVRALTDEEPHLPEGLSL